MAKAALLPVVFSTVPEPVTVRVPWFSMVWLLVFFRVIPLAISRVMVVFSGDHHVLGDILGDGNGLAVAFLNGVSDAVVILAIDGNAGFLGSGSSRGQRLSRDLLLGSCRGRAAALPGHFRSRAGSIFSFRGCGGGAGSILPFGGCRSRTAILLFGNCGSGAGSILSFRGCGSGAAAPLFGATGAELTSSAKTVMPLMVTTTIAARIADRILFARFFMVNSSLFSQ